MCELLGSEPKDDEIPVDRSDLKIDTQLVFSLYDKLQAKWEGMSGQYLGKDLVILPLLIEQYKFDKTLEYYAWEIIPIIDNIVADDIAKKLKRRDNSTTPPRGNT